MSGPVIAGLMACRDRLISELATKYGEDLDGWFDAMLDAINHIRRIEAENAQLRAEVERLRGRELPEGWVAVPEEPNADMRHEGHETLIGVLQASVGREGACMIYRAMLAAAPKGDSDAE